MNDVTYVEIYNGADFDKIVCRAVFPEISKAEIWANYQVNKLNNAESELMFKTHRYQTFQVTYNPPLWG